MKTANEKYKEAIAQSMAAKGNLNAELMQEKIFATKVKRQTDEMLLSKARDDLIMKELVVKQAAFMLIAMRQRILAMPQAYSKRLLNISDPKVVKRVLSAIAKEMLRDIRHLPEQIVDPHWLESLDEENL